MRVLLIEDYAPTRRAMKQLLELEGYDVDAAATVQEGLAGLDLGPDWMLLDLMLPDGDGEQVLTEVRRRCLPVKVAVLTGVTDRDRLDRVSEMRPDLVLIKPVDPDKLFFNLKRDSPGACSDS